MTDEARFSDRNFTDALTNFQDNLPRLLGLHKLSAVHAAQILHISPMAFSAWRSGSREPSLRTVLAIAEFFEVSADGLMTMPFRDLLRSELGDPDRFKRVEAKIEREEKKFRRALAEGKVPTSEQRPSPSRARRRRDT